MRMPSAPKQNHLLAALPRDVQDRLFPHLELVTLRPGQVLFEAGQTRRHVYFPTDAIVSLLNVIESGSSAEISMVGNEGVVTVDAISSTTLLNPARPDGIGVNRLELGVEVSAAGPPEIRVPIVPNRCDPHALAEDKIGTRMPLYLTLSDGTSGRLVLAASDELRAQMYAFYSAYCGLG